MTTPELMKEFKPRFVSIMRELRENGVKDPETLWLIGSLAGRLVENSGKQSWPDLKAALTNESYDSMLMTFQREGNKLAADGKGKAAHAIETVAASLIASRMADPDIVTGNDLMDQLIDRSIRAYQKHNADKLN